MYAWIWRRLPFGLPGKLVGSLLLASAMVALLWLVVFPWAQPLLPFDDVQVTQDGDVSGPGGPAEAPGGPGEAPGGPGEAPDGPMPDDGEGPPPGDEHDLPYSTERNGTPPSGSGD